MTYVIDNDFIRNNCVQEILALPLEKYCVNIKRKRLSKTDKQRAYFHILLKTFANAHGHEWEELKADIKISVLRPDELKEKIKNGKTYLCVPSSESLNIEQYGRLIEAMETLYNKYGMILPSREIFGL